MRKTVGALLGSLALMCVVGQYNANATFVYTSQSTFVSGVTALGAELPVQINDFSSLNGSTFASLTYSGSGPAYSYVISAAGGDSLFAIAPNGNKAISTYSGYDLIVNISTVGVLPVFGVGGNFFLTDDNGNLIPGTVKVTLSDGTQVTFASSATSYVGFSTSRDFGPYILSVAVNNMVGPNQSISPSMDNFAIAVVPEPATVLTDGVLILAVGIGAFYYRHRKAAQAQLA